jgi:hypothetical protein
MENFFGTGSKKLTGNLFNFSDSKKRFTDSKNIFSGSKLSA